LTAEGESVDLDFNKAPHVLMAGMTGSGKSVFLTSLLSEMIDVYSPWQLVMHLVDPKRVELAMFKDAPHLLDPPATDTETAIHYLRWAEQEMDRRFMRMEAAGVRHNDDLPQPFAHYLFVVDELANLMLTERRTIEPSIVALATMGRAAGIHLILSTQRPSADVLTGLIRANVPTRICLPVLTQWDSRIVLDQVGGEHLNEPGQALARLPGSRRLVRFRGLYRTTQEIETNIIHAIQKTQWLKQQPAMQPMSLN